MKRVFTILVAILLTSALWAQSPEKMSYQAVVRDASSVLVTDQSVGMQISILQGAVDGTAVYEETQTPTSNANGLVSLEIGTGTIVSGDFTSIDWVAGPYFIKTETDPTGGTSYTISGTSQLMSVPYALHAKTAESITGGITETDPEFIAWDKTTGISITESQISDLAHTVDTDTQLDETAVDAFVENNGYLTSFTEIDADITNEIQDLQLVDNDLTITNNGAATTINLSAYLDNTDTQLSDSEIATMGYIKDANDADADASNEIQDLELIGNDLTITNNGAATDIDLSAYLDNTDTQLSDADITALGYIKDADDADADATNEIELPTTANAGDMNYWNGTAWVVVTATANEAATLQMIGGIPTWVGGTPPPSVGDFRYGGVVFWVDGSGGGLVCDVNDLSAGIKWGNFSTTGATGTAVGTGQTNTNVIVTDQGAGSYVAKLCDDLTLNGYSDWFLPSKDELNEMCQNRAIINTTALANSGSSFASSYYWSSTEYDTVNAWLQIFTGGATSYYSKSATNKYVRAVRAF